MPRFRLRLDGPGRVISLDALLDGRTNVWLQRCLRQELNIRVAQRSLSYYRTHEKPLPPALELAICEILDPKTVTRRVYRGGLFDSLEEEP